MTQTLLSRRAWTDLMITTAILMGAEIEFVGLNGHTFWCVCATGSTYHTRWRCAEEYLRCEHGLAVCRDGSTHRIKP